MPLPSLRVAAAHVSPHLLNTPSTLQKTITCISDAATNNASLICFPESFIPGFPIWSALLPPSHPSTHTFFARFVEQSIYADGLEVDQIREAARKHGISVSIGFSEKARHSEGTLWNSNLLIDETGTVKVHHRKLVPTFYERLSWGNGDGHGLRTTDIAVGQLDNDSTGGTKVGDGEEARRVKVGALICGENTNLLARYAMMSQGQHVHISTWPAVWPTRMPMEPSNPSPSSSAGDHQDGTTGQSNTKDKGQNYDNILANRLRAGAHCFEAKCFGVMCAAHFSSSNLTTLTSLLDASDTDTKLKFEYALKNTSQAASMFLDPTGTPVPAFAINGQGERQEKEMLRGEEGVLFADLDLAQCVEGKQYHDVVGGYQRFDVFELMVNRTRRDPVTFTDVGLEKV